MKQTRHRALFHLNCNFKPKIKLKIIYTTLRMQKNGKVNNWTQPNKRLIKITQKARANRGWPRSLRNKPNSK